MKNNLIINADDFGLSNLVNKAIIQSFELGIINSTSLMANTSASEQAVEMANSKGYSNCIGVHVNLTDGKPLTNFKHAFYLQDDGSWNKMAILKMGFLTRSEIRNDFSKEIIAQINAVRAFGINPTHINSHHHVHTLPGLFSVFMHISRSNRYNLRLAQTHFSGNYLKSAYRKYINSVIKRSKLHFSDYFETIQSYSENKKSISHGKVEIMVHPALNGNNVLVDELYKENLGNEYREFYNTFK